MKHAVILCTCDLLGGGLGPLLDAGVSVFGSFDSSHQDRTVILGIEGDALPDECDDGVAGPLRLVSVEFTQEAYGLQRITRVSAIKIVEGRTILDLSPPMAREAA